jgi:two-component system nitrogen regulation sensor histidine kinase NtrY
LNILKNAGEAIETRKAELEFQGKISVVCFIKDDQDFIVVSIFDNGAGIPKEIIDRISEPYVTTKKNGTGLGLSIVKKIIEEHGGTFSVSNTEEGAMVSFSLKLNKPLKSEGEHEQSSQQ